MNISSMIIVKLVRPLMHNTQSCQALVCKCFAECRWIYNQIEVFILFTIKHVLPLIYFTFIIHIYIYLKAVVSSGLLFTYLFFNKLTSKPGSVNTVIGWSQLIIHRFIRILPPYLALVVLLEPLSFFLCRFHHCAY